MSKISLERSFISISTAVSRRARPYVSPSWARSPLQASLSACGPRTSPSLLRRDTIRPLSTLAPSNRSSVTKPPHNIENGVNFLRDYFSAHGSGASSLLQQLQLMSSSKIDEATHGLKANRFHAAMPLFGESDISEPTWREFHASWQRLVQDRYMGDGGT